MYDQMFGERLYKLRTTKTKASARDMSLSLGQSVNYINTIENKRSFPKMQTFFYICEYLGVTPREFFDFENADPVMNDELMSEIKKLDYKEKEHVLALVRDINKRR